MDKSNFTWEKVQFLNASSPKVHCSNISQIHPNGELFGLLIILLIYKCVKLRLILSSHNNSEVRVELDAFFTLTFFELYPVVFCLCFGFCLK